MDRFAGRTVADHADGYALIEERRQNHPCVGEPAPDFELDLYRGEGRRRLSSFRGVSPVVLVFGSLT